MQLRQVATDLAADGWRQFGRATGQAAHNHGVAIRAMVSHFSAGRLEIVSGHTKLLLFQPLQNQQHFAVLPPSDALYRKLCSLMIDPNIHKAAVLHQIVDAIRDGFLIGDGPILIHIDGGLLPSCLPFSPVVLESSMSDAPDNSDHTTRQKRRE
jgi:hypothetical protein